MARNNISFRMDENKIFNKNPNRKCATVRCFWGGFNWGSPTARIFGVAKT